MQVKTLMNILSEWDENEEIYIGLIMRFTDLLDNLVDEDEKHHYATQVEAWNSTVRRAEKHWDYGDEWSEIENLFMRSAEVKEEE